VIGGLIDDMLRAAEDARDAASEALFEPTLRIGVTGLSRAGKTVFITSLVANLLERGRMDRLSAQAEGRIAAVALRPHPQRDAPRFDFEGHMAALSAAEPRWPQSTRALGKLRLSIRYRPRGWLSGLTGMSTLHLDIVDYPGEWLLDLPLMRRDFVRWSAEALAGAEARPALSAGWRAALAAVDPEAGLDEATATGLAEAWRAYLRACRAAGLSGVTPGRMLAPGELEGSPALTFAPLPPHRRRRGSLGDEFARRYASYVSAVVRPFFRDHFASLDRQVVLVDVLSALDAGPAALADLRAAMIETLACFRTGPDSWLADLTGRRIERVLFAATKADHIHHSQHDRLTAILKTLLRDAAERARFRGAKTEALAVAGLRATVEQEVPRDGRLLPMVRGRLLATGRQAALFAGELPREPQAVLAAARNGEGGEGLLDGSLKVMAFAPPPPGGRPGDGPPHIRLDAALEFLIGDRLG
jgi:predicted YcjX-like family ATPase